MADPICRWRNPYIPTVLELINLLPKEELTQARAREIVNANSPYDFYRTPYQLACQLGLYHETNGRYFPKFTFKPTVDEVKNYLQNWIIHYCVPNPYTKGFENLAPFSIHAELCRRLLNSRTPLNWEEVKTEIFSGNIGNSDILINSINSYSPIILINNQSISLKNNTNYDDLPQYINVDTINDRDNREYFFDLFTISTYERNVDEITTSISPHEIELINQLQNLPNITQTEKNQIITARIGQGYFRRSLISECPYCPITLVDDSNLLIASHIKPWRNSNNQERLNPKNGILLTPTYDHLFDKGYISFRGDKTLIVSRKISEENIQRLKLVPNQVIQNLPIRGREEFLEYHRNVIFLR